MSVAALEAELAQYENRLGQLQSEIGQSNAIIQRVKQETDQKEHELALLVQQLERSQDVLMKAEKLTNTTHSLVTQALQNQGVVPANVLAKLHLLDAAQKQITEGMASFPATLTDRPSTPTPQRPQQIATQQQQQQQQRVAPVNAAAGSPLMRQSSSSAGLNSPQSSTMPRLVRQTSSQPSQPNPQPVQAPVESQDESAAQDEDNYQYFGLSSC